MHITKILKIQENINNLHTYLLVIRHLNVPQYLAKNDIILPISPFLWLPTLTNPISFRKSVKSIKINKNGWRSQKTTNLQEIRLPRCRTQQLARHEHGRTPQHVQLSTPTSFPTRCFSTTQHRHRQDEQGQERMPWIGKAQGCSYSLPKLDCFAFYGW